MGRENTITTGNVGGKRVARTVGNSGRLSNTSRNLKPSPYDYGIVTYVDSSSKSIFYSPVEDNQSFTKPGQAIPLYPNSQQVPPVGGIVPLLRAPDSNITSPGQNYNKVTYYLDHIGINGTVNANTVTVGGTTGNTSLPAKVTLNTEEVLNNAKFVKEFLKSQGLTKEQAAGIMGNIQTESNFNPTAQFNDLNGYVSYGLIQWNGRYVSPDLVGNTVETQVKALFDPNVTKNISKYLDEIKNKPNETAETYAYIFAKEVEICFGCNEGFDVYKNGKQTKSGDTYKPYKRSEFALDFMNKFNNTSDPLAW